MQLPFTTFFLYCDIPAKKTVCTNLLPANLQLLEMKKEGLLLKKQKKKQNQNVTKPKRNTILSINWTVANVAAAFC